MDKEFVRVGYYVNNEYLDEELKETPPLKPQFDKLHRSILADKPRVTRFTVPWDSATAVEQREQQPQPMMANPFQEKQMGAGMPQMMMDV